MDLGLKDKRALVTGASRGLGYATARLLAQEGCRVIINSRNEARIKSAAEKISMETGVETQGLPADLSLPSIPEKLVERAALALGGLDLLLTNTGGPAPSAFEAVSEKLWLDSINLSFLSHVRLIRAALPHLRKSTAASVLTVTSIAVKQPLAYLVLSNSIRAATAGLTKSLAQELGRDAIRFNSILPGSTRTERIQELMQFRSRQNGTTIEEEAAKDAAASALGRMAEPEEFAQAAVFLLSPASSYITGSMLLVDGGAYRGTW